jgi:hypothetical protein
MKLEYFRQILEKSSSVKFKENPSSRIRFFHADGKTDRQTDTTKLIVIFRNFAKAPKNCNLWRISII